MAAGMLCLLLVVHRAVADVIPKKQADKLLMQKLQEELMQDNADYDAANTTSTKSTTPAPTTHNPTKATCYQIFQTESSRYEPSRYYRNRFKIITPSIRPQPSTRGFPEFRGISLPLITGAQKYPIFRRTKSIYAALVTKGKSNITTQHTTKERSSSKVYEGPVFRGRDLDSKELAKVTVYRHKPTTKSTTVTETETLLTNSLPDILINPTPARNHKRSQPHTTPIPESDEKSIASEKFKTYASPTLNRNKKTTISRNKAGFHKGGGKFGRFASHVTTTKDNTDLEAALKRAVSRALARVAEHKKHNYEFNFNSSMRRADYLRWKYAQGVI